tara:strand:- start:1509 stop:1823 length:315 start_codon:yes stop_codon:yes gene_type:complete
MAKHRDTPLSMTPDTGNMQSYGKYEGPSMKASKVVKLDSRPVNNSNMSKMKSKLKSEYDNNEDTKANIQSTKKFMKMNAIGGGIIGGIMKLADKYGNKGEGKIY